MKLHSSQHQHIIVLSIDYCVLQAGAELENDLFYLDQNSFTKETIEPLVEMMYTGQLKVIPRIVRIVLDTSLL